VLPGRLNGQPARKAPIGDLGILDYIGYGTTSSGGYRPIDMMVMAYSG